MTDNRFTFSYRADGQRATQGDPSGATTTFGYDKLGRMTDKDVADANCTSSVCGTLDYTYNRAGQRLTEAQDTMGTPGTDGTATFTYDKIGRITGYDSPLGGTSTDQAYGWQKVPNRDSLTIGTGAPVTTTYDDADRPTSTGFTHDADGRMTARTGRQFVWDSLGRLTTVKTSGGTTISAYTYDALDRLREVTRSGTTLRFRYMGTSTNRIQNRNVTTSTSGRRVAWDWTRGTMLADFNGVDSGIRYYGTNGHRDTVWIGDGTGAVTATVRYDPWGGILASSGTVPDWRFQGSWYDTDTDLQWVVTRWYAPTLGRFISEDTLLGEPRNPLSRHLYGYAEGDPVGGWDPDGRKTAAVSFRSSRVKQNEGDCVFNSTVKGFDVKAKQRHRGAVAETHSDCSQMIMSEPFRFTTNSFWGVATRNINVALDGDYEWTSMLNTEEYVLKSATGQFSVQIRRKDGPYVSGKLTRGWGMECAEVFYPSCAGSPGQTFPAPWNLDFKAVGPLQKGKQYQLRVIAKVRVSAYAAYNINLESWIGAEDMEAEVSWKE